MKKKFIYNVVLTFICISLVLSTQANNKFNGGPGGTGTNWFNPGNWSESHIPTNTEIAEILFGLTCNINFTNAVCDGLIVKGTLNLNNEDLTVDDNVENKPTGIINVNNAEFIIWDNLVNEGEINLSGNFPKLFIENIVENKVGATLLITPSLTPAFYNLKVGDVNHDDDELKNWGTITSNSKCKVTIYPELTNKGGSILVDGIWDVKKSLKNELGTITIKGEITIDVDFENESSVTTTDCNITIVGELKNESIFYQNGSLVVLNGVENNGTLSIKGNFHVGSISVPKDLKNKNKLYFEDGTHAIIWGKLENGSIFTSPDYIQIKKGATVQVAKDVNNNWNLANSNSIKVWGKLYAYENLTNHGELYCFKSGNIRVWKDLENDHYIKNIGMIDVRGLLKQKYMYINPGTTKVRGKVLITPTGILINGVYKKNSNNINSKSDPQFIIEEGSLVLEPGAQLINNEGIVSISDTIINDGDIENYDLIEATELINSGDISNSSQFKVENNFNHYQDTLNNLGCFFVYNNTYGTAVVDNSGVIYVHGTDSLSITGTIINDPVQVVSVSTTDVSAPGANDGSASVSISDPSGYSFLWSNGDTTQSLVGLSPGTYSVYFSDNVHCGDNASDVVLDASMNNWQGDESTDWFDPFNWSDTIVPVYEEVGIPPGQPYMPVIEGGQASTGDCSIFSGSTLTIDPGGSLTSWGDFENNGDFVIESDSSGYSGSFINKFNITGTGTFSFNRNITGTGAHFDPAGWHYISSPISGFSSDKIYDYFLNTWDEPNNLWAHYEGSTPCIPAPNKTISPMEGWSVKFDENYNCDPPNVGTGTTIEFNGNINDINTDSISRTFTASHPNPPNQYDNWNLLGNPYPSAIECSSIVFPAELDNSIYYYDDAILNYKVWAGGVGAPQIPPTQGFFVRATGNGTLTFNNTMRTHTGANIFYKSEINNLLTLQINGNGFNDNSYIRFLDEATPSFDSKWDAYKLLSGVPEVPQVYTATSKEILSINSMPETDMVPLYFEVGKSGEYTLEVTEANDFDIVILEDKLTGAKTDLLAEPYTFNFVEGDKADRFMLYFKDVPIVNDEYRMNIYSENSNVFVINTDNLQGEVDIYNLLGQQIKSTGLSDGRNIITLDDPKGIYIVKVKTNEIMQTKKVYLK